MASIGEATIKPILGMIEVGDRPLPGQLEPLEFRRRLLRIPAEVGIPAWGWSRGASMNVQESEFAERSQSKS